MSTCVWIDKPADLWRVRHGSMVAFWETLAQARLHAMVLCKGRKVY